MSVKSSLFRTVESKDRKGRPCINLYPYGRNHPCNEGHYSISLTEAKLITVHRSAIEAFVVKHTGGDNDS